MLRTITSRLVAVLVALSAALTMLAVAAWTSLGVDYQDLSRLKDERLIPLTELKTVSDMYAVDIVDTAHKLRNKDIDWATGLTSLRNARDRIAANWAVFTGTEIVAADPELVGETRRAMNRADAAVLRLIELAERQDAAGLDDFVATTLYPAIDPVTAKIRALVDGELIDAANDFYAAEREFRADLRLLGILTAVGLLTIALGAGVVVFGVSRPLAALSLAMRRLARGDLDAEVPFMARSDEMGSMARAIESFRAAERRNRTLQADADRQTQWVHRIVDLAPVGITILGEDGRVTMRNAAMQQIHPHPQPERLIGVTLAELIYEVFCGNLAPGDPKAADAAQFVDALVAKYRAADEGRFEAKFPSGADVDTHFRHVGEKGLIIVHTDVSALRQAERQAVAAENRLRSIVDSVPIGLAVYDTDERVVLRNERIVSYFGTPTPAGPGATNEGVLRVSPPDEVRFEDGTIMTGEAAIDAVLAIYRTRSEGTLSTRVGNNRYAVTFRNVPNVGRTVAATDVTDLIRARQDADMAARRLNDAIAALPVSFALFAPDRTLVMFNEEFRKEFRNLQAIIRPGCPAAEIVDAYWTGSAKSPPSVDLADWERGRGDLARRAANLARATEGFLRNAPAPVDVERDYGTYRLRRVALASGEVVRVSENITDLREKEAEVRRLGEQALAARTAILQEFIDTIPQAVAVVGQDDHLRFANRALVDLIGASRAPGDGLTLEGLLAAAHLPALVVADLVARRARETETVSSENKPLRIQITPVPTGDALITISDLSEQRRAEAERLEHQQRVLQAEKSQALVTLAGSVAHDFNNLLAVILGFSTLAVDEAQKLLDEAGSTAADAAELSDIKSSLSKVISSAERGRNVVATLNALIRERQVAVAPLDLRDVLRDTEQLLRVLFPASVRLEMKMAETPCIVRANATQIEQIVTNLCINAVHALDGKAGQVTVAVDVVEVGGSRSEGLRVTEAAAHRQGAHIELSPDGTAGIFVGLLAKGPHVRLRIIDDGHGMTEQVARDIFKPFFTTKGPGQGTGLGLSSVLELVSAHHGGIHVRTRPMTGTVFMILFPVASQDTAAGDAAPEGASQRIPAEDIRTETRILVVDDEPALAELAEKTLRKAGYEADAFSDPKAALERFRDDPQAFDLIVTDQTMPGMTGLELVEQVLPVRPDIPILVCTGHVSDVERHDGLPTGVRGVLRKPYAPGDLAKLVRETLAA